MDCGGNIYPAASLGCPTWEFNQSVNQFLRRTGFDNGWTRQRRRWPNKKQDVTLTFVINTLKFSDWVEWVKVNGHDWFEIDLDTYNGEPLRVKMRFITPAEWQYTNFDTIRVQITGELNNE